MTKFEQVAKVNLLNKTAEIRKRLLRAIDQLNEEQLNWRFNDECNSIANLIVHIQGNIHQRIEAGILGKQDTRDREAEFEPSVRLTFEEAKKSILESFDLLANTISDMSSDDLLKEQTVRGKSVTVFDVLNQCNAHFSEHLGQILYVSKMILAENYVITSIPKKH